MSLIAKSHVGDLAQFYGAAWYLTYLFLISQVDSEIKKFTWNIENLQVLATNPNLKDMHVLPFTVGATIDRVSKWKFFLAPDSDNENSSVTLFFQLVEYRGSNELPVTLRVAILGGNNYRYAFCKGKKQNIKRDCAERMWSIWGRGVKAFYIFPMLSITWEG